MNTKVLIAKTKNIISEGIVNRLTTETTIQFMGWVTDPAELQRAYDTHKPDCLIIGTTLFGERSAEKIREFNSKNPNAKVLVISTSVNQAYVRKMLDAGSKGIFLATDSTYDHLMFGVKCVSNNQVFLCRKSTEVMLGKLLLPQGSEIISSILSDREKQVVILIADGKSSKEIAIDISIAHATVDVHRRNIMRKIGVHKTAEITKYAIQKQMVFV